MTIFKILESYTGQLSVQGAFEFVVPTDDVKAIYDSFNDIPYDQEESEQIAYVLYFSRRVSTAFLGMGRSSTKFVTTLPTLSENSWELNQD